MAALVTVFRELRRVLRSDGTFWLNIGDSYANDGKWGGSTSGKHVEGLHGNSGVGRTRKNTGFKAKDRMMIPARLAIALQDDGWYLRDEIVWHKPNPMPSPVGDRTTTAHEMVYLLTKQPRYWYDAEAIAEPASNTGGGDFMRELNRVQLQHGGESRTGRWARDKRQKQATRNRRSVWTISPEPFPASHFAVMPPKLVELCILAGCPPAVCGKCGAPHRGVYSEERELNLDRPQARRALELFERHGLTDEHLAAIRAVGLADAGKARSTMTGAGNNDSDVQRLADEAKAALGGYYREFTYSKRSSNGQKATCDCDVPTVSGIVIDPFMGAGTVALVARQLKRRWIGSEINAEYVRLANMRLQGRLDEYIAEQRGKPFMPYMFTEGAQP